MGIQKVTIADIDNIAPLIAKFRVEIQGYKQIKADENLEAAKVEFSEYINAGFPVFAYTENKQCIGYLVCRVDMPVVWVESLYVLEGHRRKGVASALFDAAEKLAASYGEETLYVYAHPNNDGIIALLNKKGYNVLNLIEIRKPLNDEIITEQIRIRNNTFDY